MRNVHMPALIQRWRDARRWRRAFRVDYLADDVVNRLWADGYGFTWRLTGDAALGSTLDGEPAEIPLEEFLRRYLSGQGISEV